MRGRKLKSRQGERGLAESRSQNMTREGRVLMSSGLTWDEENLAATEIGKDSLMCVWNPSMGYAW